jgi:hypothetical protein
MTDFFDLPKENFVKSSAQNGKKVDQNIYNPDPDAYNGSYKSVFRFIPYVHDKSLSKYTKYSAKFYNPLTKESLYVDCPSNIEKPSILWDLERVIKSLKEEEPELHKQLESSFSRWHTHHSPVYIKKDPQRPELEGSIKIFKFSAQINNLIESQINPEENDLLESVSSVNPYHLLEGKDFLCVVGKKTRQYRDWSKSKFMDETTPLIFKIGDKQISVENNEKSVKLVQEFMKKNTPEMDSYLHQAWTDETREKVAEAIVSIITNKSVLNLLFERSKDEEMKSLIKSKISGTPSPAKSAKQEDLTTDEDDLIFKSDANDLPFNNELKMVDAQSGEGDDEYDELFKGL